MSEFDVVTYDDDRDVGIRSSSSPRVRVGHSCIDPTRAKQQFKEQSDINYILRNYEKTGILSNVNIKEPQYGFVPSFDFREALETIGNAHNSFMQLPADLRREFENDPAKFVDFVSDPNNSDRLVELGLSSPVAEPDPVPAEPAPDPDPPAG